MESRCSSTPGAQPSFLLELRRGLNFYNLSVGLLSSIAIAGAAFFLAAGELVPVPMSLAPITFGAAVGAVAFISITILHTAAHAYFGWRFGRGLAAHQAGDTRRAIKLLRPAAWRGMDHYDPNGIAREALCKLNVK